MQSAKWNLLAAGLAWCAVAATPQVSSSGKESARFDRSVRPFVEKQCLACHSGKGSPAGIDLTAIRTHNQMVNDPGLWDRISRAVARGSMPPKGAKQPSSAERADFLQSITSILAAECRLASPGRVTLRRLNRAEYENTVRDLTGISMNLADDFPSDDVGFGFDNNGDVLSLSPLLMEKYLAAAEKIANAAIVLPDRRKVMIAGESFSADGSVNLNGESWGFFSQGTISVNHLVKSAGDFQLTIVAFADQAGPEVAKLSVSVDARLVQTIEVPGTRAQPGCYPVTVKLGKGNHTLSIAFINDFYEPNNPDPKRRDRNLHVLSMTVDGPLGAPANLPAGHRMLVPSPLTDQTVNTAISKLAKRAYRRPPSEDEVTRLRRLCQVAVDAGEPMERGMQLVLQALLASPNFLFRPELDAKQGERKLNGYELASRISYFLWSSMPDEALLAAAESGALDTDSGLKEQINRMLASPKVKALSENFLGQWLQLKKLDVLSLDPVLFPEANEALLGSMKRETELLFEEGLKENRPLTHLLESETSFVNGPLAKLYGIPAIQGNTHQKVSVSKFRLGGILGHASFLALTSNPTRTSPVKRGKWILENLLGDPTPPPPPNVGVLDDKPNIVTGKTLRERLAQHIKKPECAGCHARLDPWGLALDSYDPLGRLRTHHENEPINLLVSLPDGTKMEGPQDVRNQLMKRKSEFVHCFVEKFMTYAIGRGMTPADRCHIDQVVSEGKAQQDRLQTLILGVIKSKPFQMKGSNP